MILSRRYFSHDEDDDSEKEVKMIKLGKASGNVMAGLGAGLLGYSVFNKSLENTDFGKKNPKILRPDLRRNANIAGAGLAIGGLALRGASEYYDRKRKKKSKKKEED